MNSSPVRTIYHTHIKCLVRNGLLDASLVKQIPRSNVSRWKAESEDKYFDFGLGLTTDDDLDVIRSFARDQKARRVYAAYVRLVKTILTIAHGTRQFHRIVKANSKNVVLLVQRVRQRIGLKRALQFFNISVATFRNWAVQSHTQCFTSGTGTCNRIFPNQLTRLEVSKMKDLLADPQFQYWPVSSVALHALRNNLLPLSLNTWYKYVNQFGWARTRPDIRRKKNSVSIRADRPHQLWHADITVFTTANQVKQYIYLVVDNFSRKILAWKVADVVSATVRRETINEALNLVSVTQPLVLITDGGPENKLQHFLKAIGKPVRHSVALVDVHFSNSLVEAHNKLIKYQYLYRMNIDDEFQLQQALRQVVEDFNNRPHISLDGLTPNEAEQNYVLDRVQLHRHKLEATSSRKVYNQQQRCTPCA